MQKNVKSIFLVATLLFLLVGVSAISASEVSNGTTVLEDTTDTVAPEITTSDKIVDTTTKNIKTEDKTNENLKTDSISLDEIEYSQIITDQEYNDDIYVEGENYYFKNCYINNMEIYLFEGILTLENCVVNTERPIEKAGDGESTIYLINTTFNKDLMLYGCNAYCEKINFSDFSIVVSQVEIPEVIIPPFFGQPEIVIPAHSLGGELIINDSDINNKITGIDAQITFINSRINNTINSTGENGSVTFDTETVFYPNAIINSTNIIIDDINRVIPYFVAYNDSYILSNIIIGAEKLNLGNLTLLNSTINNKIINKGTLILNNTTINSTIDNRGVIYIDDDVTLGENAQIIGLGEIIINDITSILPIIDTINGNYEINDTTLTKNYAFNGEVTLNNCTINTPNNSNFGTLTLNKCNIDVNEDETFLTNYRTLNISDDTTITGKVVNLVGDGSYIITQDNIGYFFDQTGLTQIVKPGDTLDIQGTIRLNQSLIINKPVNIISTTNDGYVDLDTHAGSMTGDEPGNCFVINNEGSYTNVTGIYFHNTQLWIANTHHVTLDNISAVVENQAVGSGVGQTSIRENSTYVTLKNSYIYTENNGGSSSVVLAWADNCVIQNNTIKGVGFVGNLVYLTTFNIYIPIPDDVKPNTNNQILDNVIIGPEQASGICVPIMLSGANNTVENNLIYYVGESGIGGQWNGEGYTDTQNNTMTNNTHIRHAPQNELRIDTTNFTTGETTTISASLYFTNKVLTDINKGKVTFKVNGKTIKDANGKVIYAKVVNGTATIENYLVPNDWIKEGSTIEAVYSGSTQCEKLTSEKTNITITSPEPTITVTPITSDVQTGSTVTLKAKVAVGDKAITTGKIVFKVNGKTVKDTNGKVIYAKVDANGEVSVNYTIPESFKAGTYNIEAVFTASGYDKLTDNTTMTVVKS